MVSVPEAFVRSFGAAPEVVASAPGRVNLLGEHTDYNDGFVLPTAIPQATRVALRCNGEGQFHVRADDLDEATRFTLDGLPEPAFARYVYGCLREASALGIDVPAMDILLQSDVPIGVGLSSSAALEVALLRALRLACDLHIDDVRIAQMAQRAEVEYAGVRCGIMDQMASALCDTTSMLFLDTRTLERRLLALPAGTEIVVIDSGTSRSLAGSGYNTRRDECERAASLLGVPALRDVTDPEAVERLPEPLRRRARHVVRENARVLQAASGVDAATFGALMAASHASLRDDFEVSTHVLDRLVELLAAQPGVFGARLTGAGFGGACVALCQAGNARDAGAAVLKAFDAGGQRGRVLVPAVTSALHARQ